MSKYTEYFKPFLNIKKDSFVSNINKIKQLPFDKQPQHIENLIKNGCADGSGYYSSYELEKLLLKQAEILDCSTDNIPCKKNHFIHVMTEPYFSGGHTRVAERWIELSPEDQVHHLFFTTSNVRELTDRLKNAVTQKNGTITYTKNNETIFDRAKKLRQAASEAEYVILHTHMYDSVPIIAFGTKKFKRPVIYFNHADHLFWLGISIADIVADLKTLGQNITLNKRKAHNSFLLGIPLEKSSQKQKYDKYNIREELNIPQDKKVVLTYGMIHKYRPILDINFFNYTEELLKDKNIMVIMIGPRYKEIKKKINTSVIDHENFRLLKRVPHYELIKYISSADLVADSFPMVGGTAMIDAINYGAPVVTLKDFVGQMDYIINSPAYCKDIDELINKSKTLLYDKEAAAENINKLKELTKNYNNPNIFREKLINLYNSLPQNHNIYSFSNDDNYEFIDGDIFAYYSTTSHKSFKLLGFKFISISFKNYLGKKIHHFFIQKHDKISQIF